MAPVGVTALEWPDAGPEPLALAACTVNVYDVPGVRLRTLAVVAGGEPVTVVVACAVEPMYGVTMYEVGGPPDDGAVQVTVAAALPAVAVTPDTPPGDGVGRNRTSTQ